MGKTLKTKVNSTNEITDHPELTTDEGATIERVATQELATDLALKVKNEEAEANSTPVTELKTQTKLPKNQLQRPLLTTTLKTKTQPKKPKKTPKTLSQKNQSKFSSLSKSTWLVLLLHLKMPHQNLPEKLTTATTS